MPVRIAVALAAEHDRAAPPPHTGPAINAAFLAAVHDQHPDLANALHDTARYKPYTLTPLLRTTTSTTATAGVSTSSNSSSSSSSSSSSDASFEVALLADELTGPVLGALTAVRRYRVGRTFYHPTGTTVVATASYDDLARSAQPVTSWTFRLRTPVGFASAADEPVRRVTPWPDPVRVMINLATRWRHFAGAFGLPPGTDEAITSHLEAVAGQVRIEQHLVEASKLRSPSGYLRGAVGTVTFAVADDDRVSTPVRYALDALARFADYAGFGHRTAMGMGVVRLTPGTPPASDNARTDTAPQATQSG